MMEGDVPRAPEEVVIWTPATTPSRDLVTSEDCTLAMSEDFTTVADPVQDSLVLVPNATTIVPSSISESWPRATLMVLCPATAISWLW